MADTATAAEKAQFIQTFQRELPTTLKVLRAFPAEKSGYKPHERSNTALQLAWTFVVENQLAMGALKGPLNLGGGFPPAPSSYDEIVNTYEASAKQMLDTLTSTPDSRLNEKVAFPSGPKQMGEYRVMDFLWFMLMDSIHHRGQLSVYIRPAGGKVPSIYGPSGDEPWM
jgi:uncharacterized damage-inducible protein DinB